jgi:hypothetical protein
MFAHPPSNTLWTGHNEGFLQVSGLAALELPAHYYHYVFGDVVPSVAEPS